MTEQWMSIVEYARTFSISDMTVRRRIKNGKLKAVLRDGKYFIQVDRSMGDSNLSPPVPAFTPQTAINDRPAAARTESNSSVSRQSQGLYLEKGGAIGKSESTWNMSEAKISTLTDGFRGASAGSRDLTAMLEYCERSLNRINSIERHIADSYKSKLSYLESENKRKDLEISQLRQTVEDLQILIKMYDKEPR